MCHIQDQGTKMDLKGKGLFYGDDKFPTEYDDGTVNCALRLGSTPTLKLQSAGEATLRQPQVINIFYPLLYMDIFKSSIKCMFLHSDFFLI